MISLVGLDKVLVLVLVYGVLVNSEDDLLALGADTAGRLGRSGARGGVVVDLEEVELDEVTKPCKVGGGRRSGAALLP